MLDVDCTDESTVEIADAMQHSLARLFGTDISNIPTRFYRQCTDSGGGGTERKLYLALQQLKITSISYLITSCSLHNLQTGLRNGVQLVLGEGGLDANGKGKLNAMQLLHGVYNIQNWHEHDELKDIYLYTRKEEGLSETFIINLRNQYLLDGGLLAAVLVAFLIA